MVGALLTFMQMQLGGSFQTTKQQRKSSFARVAAKLFEIILNQKSGGLRAPTSSWIRRCREGSQVPRLTCFWKSKWVGEPD